MMAIDLSHLPAWVDRRGLVAAAQHRDAPYRTQPVPPSFGSAEDKREFEAAEKYRTSNHWLATPK